MPVSAARWGGRPSPFAIQCLHSLSICTALFHKQSIEMWQMCQMCQMCHLIRPTTTQTPSLNQPQRQSEGCFSLLPNRGIICQGPLTNSICLPPSRGLGRPFYETRHAKVCRNDRPRAPDQLLCIGFSIAWWSRSGSSCLAFEVT